MNNFYPQPRFDVWPPRDFPVSIPTGLAWLTEPPRVEPVFPRLYLAMADVVTVELDRDVMVNVSTNKNVRLYLPNRIALSCSRFGHGQVAAIHHPDFGYIQDGAKMFAKLPTGHCVTGEMGQFRLFHPDPNGSDRNWNITGWGVKRCGQADHPMVDFPTKQVDVTLEAFNYRRYFHDSQEGQRQIVNTYVGRDQNGVKVRLNGISIHQRDTDGFVEVIDADKRVLTLDPTSGSGSVWTQPISVSISPEGRAELQLPDRRLWATADQIEVAVGQVKAEFDAELNIQPGGTFSPTRL